VSPVASRRPLVDAAAPGRMLESLWSCRGGHGLIVALLGGRAMQALQNPQFLAQMTSDPVSAT
jgi:hypothetical protein